MRMKRFLAGAEARTKSMIPLEKRLASTQKKIQWLETNSRRIQSEIATEETAIGAYMNAVELAVKAEARAENRLEAATGERDQASARLDLKNAEKLANQSRKKITKSDQKIAKLKSQLDPARLMRRRVEDDDLKVQIAAKKSAGPTRTARLITSAKKIESATRKKTQAGTVSSSSTPAAKIKITGTGPVVRHLKLKKGDTFHLKPGRVSRPQAPTIGNIVAGKRVGFGGKRKSRFN